MSNVFTLDSLREAAQKKFAPVKIGLSDGTDVTLSSLLKLNAENRKAVSAALEDLNAISDEEDTDENYELLVEAISKIFNAIADKPAKLLREVEDADVQVKVALMSDILSLWVKETQLGEA